MAAKYEKQTAKLIMSKCWIESSSFICECNVMQHASPVYCPNSKMLAVWRQTDSRFNQNLLADWYQLRPHSANVLPAESANIISQQIDGKNRTEPVDVTWRQIGGRNRAESADIICRQIGSRNAADSVVWHLNCDVTSRWRFYFFFIFWKNNFTSKNQNLVLYKTFI